MGVCRSVPEAKVASDPDLDKRSLEAVFDSAQLLEGNEKALQWCSEERLETVTALISAEERVSEALGLQILERKRLLRSLGLDRDVGLDVVSDPPTKAGLVEAPEDINKRLHIRLLSGNVIQMSIKASENILAAKMQLRESDVFLKDKQFVLISQGLELMNRWSLADCGLRRDAEVHLSLREACKIELEGLASLLQKAELIQYQFEFTFFLARFGAVHLNEIREHATAARLVDFVGLQDAEKARFFSALDIEQFLKSKREEEKAKADAVAEAHFQQWIIGHPDVIAPEELEGVHCVCHTEPILNITFPGWLEVVKEGSREEELSVCWICVLFVVVPCPPCILAAPGDPCVPCWRFARDKENVDSTWVRITPTDVSLRKTFHRKKCGLTSCEKGRTQSSCGVLCCPRYYKADRNAARDKFQREQYAKAPMQQAMCDPRKIW